MVEKGKMKTFNESAREDIEEPPSKCLKSQRTLYVLFNHIFLKIYGGKNGKGSNPL